MARRPGRTSKSSGVSSQVHASVLYYALLEEGRTELALAFWTWWVEHSGLSPEAVIQSDYPPGFDVDELGIDQEDDLWP